MLDTLKNIFRAQTANTNAAHNDAVTGVDVPDREMYSPVFHPWHNSGKGEFKEIMDAIASFTLVSPDRCHILYSLAIQATNISGDFYECGVYKGGTAFLLANVLNGSDKSNQVLRLFDTFEGMPETDKEKDWHKKGDFADTDIAIVQERLRGFGRTVFYKGYLPDTFSGREGDQIAFAHIDVDIYKSIIDCCEFIYPRMTKGGFFIFDDYGFLTCPGARQAVDGFFSAKPEQPVVLPTGQAIVVKL